ncbi:MAG: fused MFS/spermidine synthase [Planctomycetota bacterium]
MSTNVSFEQATLAAETNAPASPRGRLFIPCLIVFLSGFCIMVIELVAGRLVHGFIGSSLYTWTSIIGVILAGITAGNYVGGRLADRFESKRLVATLFFLSAASTILMLPASKWIGNFTATWIQTPSDWAWRIVLVIIVSFLLPGTVLGMISPSIAKWALDYGFATGRTVGSIYSWNTVGSIVGTFVTGFILLSHYAATTIVQISSVTLVAIGACFLPAILLDMLRATTPEEELAAESTRVAKGGAGWSIFLPGLLVFLSGFAVMLVELSASRLTSTHIGQSVYTWTSVIGVILAGISVGNYLGGQMADKFPARPLVGALFLVSSFFCLSVLQTHEFVEHATLKWMGPVPWGLRVLFVVFGAFFFPAASLGTISPAVAKWALDKGYAAGRTVGTIYAWNTIGSIAGTFLTGFFLISTFYISRIVSVTSVVMAVLALMFLLVSGTWTTRILAMAWTVIAVVFTLFACIPNSRFENAVLTVWPVREIEDADPERAAESRQTMQRWRLEMAARLVGRREEINLYDGFGYIDDFQYYDESNYYDISVKSDMLDSNFSDDVLKDDSGKVLEDENGTPRRRRRLIRSLTLDALIHGHIDMADYGYLHYEYEHMYATISHRLLKKHKQQGEDLSVLFLGGGSYTFPRYLLETYPDLACVVAEIDPRVTRAVQRSLGLNAANRKKVYVIASDRKEKAPETWRSFPDGPPSISERFEYLVDSFRPVPEERQSYLFWANRLEVVGATSEEELTEKVDFVLDIRPDRSEPHADIDKARQLKLTVLGPAEFDEMCETTSHPNITTHHMDARQFVMQSQDIGKFDVIYGDAFNDFSVPAHLTTVEFNEQMAKLLKPDGIFMANVIDVWQISKFMGAYRNTLEKVFKHVYVMSTSSGRPSNTRSTFVIMCSQQPIDFEGLGKNPGEEGYAGSVMEGSLLGPVIRGGLEPIQDVTFRADGEQTTFELPTEAKQASVRVSKDAVSVTLDDDAYSLEGGKTLKMKLPPNAGSTVHVTLYSDRKIVLTDDYCPVDNMLSEVIATRVRD